MNGDGKQLDLEDLLQHGLARAADPATSKAAAAKLKANRLYAICLERLVLGSMTTEEIADGDFVLLQSITPRMKPLEAAGLVLRTSLRRTGLSGRNRIVWAISGKGREVAAALQERAAGAGLAS